MTTPRMKTKEQHQKSKPKKQSGNKNPATKKDTDEPVEQEPPPEQQEQQQSTRLFVKNLPAGATEADIRRLFQQQGRLTDVQLKYAPDGTFRRFAFVGFKTPAAASAALGQLNGAYVGSSRVQIMPCRPPPPPSPTTTAADQNQKQQKQQSKYNSSSKAAVEDDDLADEETTAAAGAPRSAAGPAGVLAGKFVVKLKGCPPGIQARTVREFFAPLAVGQVKIVKTGCAYARLATEADAVAALGYNKRCMGKKKVLVRRMTQQQQQHQQQLEKQSKRPLSGGAADGGGDDVEEKILDTGRLFVRNLPYDVTEAELTQLFEPFGQVAELHVAYQSLLKRNKGFAFVAYMFPEHALKAYRALDRTDYMGRNLHLLPGDNKPDEEEEGTDVSGRQQGQRPLTAFQRKKAQSLRAASGSHSASWNALFLGADTVASLVADQLGESKASLLAESDRAGGGGSSVAVRLAHGEADLVAKTKKFLEANGVDLSAFGASSASSSSARSDRVFLVKNLPPSAATRDQLADIYEKFPGLQRLVLPPRHGVTAVVEYATPQEARTAYKRTAFSRFVDRPLYLEWAPVGCLKLAKAAAEESSKDKATEEEKKEKVTAASGAEISRAPAKVLIRNVAFEANAKELRALLEPFGEIVGGVRLPKKPDGGHRGFAFAQFVAAESAKRAVEQLSGATHLYGRRLLLELSSGGEDASGEAGGDGGSGGAAASEAAVARLRRRAAVSVEAERAARKRSRLVLDGDGNEDAAMLG